MHAAPFVKGAFFAAVMAVSSVGAQAQTTLIDLNADGTAQTFDSFAAGTYSVTFLSAYFSAYSLRQTASGPQELYRTISTVSADGITTNLGSYAEFATQSAAVANSNLSSYFFSTSGGPVTFRVSDTVYSDNTGGVSLAVTAVPEPGTYALMLAGLAVTGLVARRRRRDI